MTERESEIISLIRQEVKPALGCTEPIAVALAVAKAVEILEERCPCMRSRQWRMSADFNVSVSVSGNILKNGMGVGIPGTGMIGLYIASALGAVCGKSEYGLEVLHDLDKESIRRAKELVEQKKIKIDIADTEHKLYIKASVAVGVKPECCQGTRCPETGEAHNDGHYAFAVIEDNHDNIVETCFDDKILQSSHKGQAGIGCAREIKEYGLTVKEIYDFARNVAFNDIAFVLEARDMNMALAEEGLKGDYGLKVGKTIHCSSHKEVFGDDFMSYAMALTAAASDARMAGCTLPAMSNSGSGNQGITVTMPIIAYSRMYRVSDEELARALTLSHLVAIHIKGYLGKLSALCGCVIASTGSSCGIVYLRGGSYTHVCSAIKNMVGNITGMVCDGAKVGCAMKVASGVSSSIQSAVLAMDGTCISENDGIIEKDIEKTIHNLARIGSIGMQNTDNMILDIMVCK
ncbi:MAG: L-serine ammonia-lyase, iron-sulfur-dependent, subunit alpha [Bacteroidales bacterium]|nr:L-serine ammonia-lyase, iron-sulfur-dependent, subunit alpha [Bacteroidales bacterium]